MLSASRNNWPLFGGLRGLGDAAATFNHSQVGFRSAPVFLRLVASMTKARDYAAGGFHVSVDRAAGGGCKDDWKIHKGGTKAATCQLPLRREDVTGLWNTAAGKYLAAFNAGQNPETKLDVMKGFLSDANSAADAAFRAEGIEPPRDPVTGASEAPVSKISSPLGGLALASTGLAAMLYFAFKHGDEGGKKSAGSLMGARRRRKRRR